MSVPSELLSDNGPFVKRIDNFSARKEQQELAEAISNAINNGESLICEAGTGTGKTLAYLVASLLSNKKIIISTGTKHLQDQIFNKDLPVAIKALGILVNPVLLKGRNNYLCLHRMKQSESDGGSLASKNKSELTSVKQWSLQTDSGDLGELTVLSENSSLYPNITSSVENCLGRECIEYDKCFVFKARKKAMESQLVIVNHHLLFADLSLKETGFGELLPQADIIIFDEAHQLPELASEFFSHSLSGRQINDLINDCRVAYFAEINDVPEFLTMLDKLQTGIKQLRLVFGTENRRLEWDEISCKKENLVAFNQFKTELIKLGNFLDEMSVRSKSLENCLHRCGNIIEMLESYLERESDEYVQWGETRGKGFILYQTPLDISERYQSRLSEHNCQCIYTSATLAVGKDFEHFACRLGLTDIKAMSWSSPFDFARQAMLYLPHDMPEPRDPSYVYHVIDRAIPVIEASQGHTFILFTSHRALEQARLLIQDRLNYPVMVQGELPRSELLNRFRNTKHAVLLGTQSFWEGVDVRGQALSCVIIDKLPFAPPDDPVLKARSINMEKNGQNPFIDYQLPEAIITLRQGVGRLIRDINDYGVLMICDPRLQSKPYGRKFIASLPEMNITGNISEVELFFRQFSS